MSTKVQLSGGAFQDVQGNALANGYLLMVLSQDAVVTDTVSKQVAAGYTARINLDSSGNVSASPAQYVWPNDVLTPANTFYKVSGYTANGELVWGPNSQQVLSSPSPFNIGAWKPNISNTTGALVNTTYDIGVFYPFTLASSQIMLLLAVDRTITFAANMGPSTAVCGTNPTANATLTLSQNGTPFGTIVFNTAGAATISSTLAVFNAGDKLQITAPGLADLTLADVGIVLSGTTVGSSS